MERSSFILSNNSEIPIPVEADVSTTLTGYFLAPFFNSDNRNGSSSSWPFNDPLMSCLLAAITKPQFGSKSLWPALQFR